MSQIEIKNLENSEIEITGEIEVSEFEKHRREAVKKVSEKFDIPGFRKGHVPENIIIQKIGETTLLEEMAEQTLAIAYPKIIADNKIEAIGRPEVSITKIAANNPLGFKIKTAIMPEIKLPDYKKISKEVFIKKEEFSVTDKEVDDVILEIRKQRAKKSSEDKDSNEIEKKESQLPDLNDELVKTLGDFKNVADLKEKLKSNILKEKEMKAQSKKRADAIEKIINETTIKLPNIVIKSELDKMMSQFEGDVSKMGLKFDEYLKHIKKSKDDLEKEWWPEAEKRSKIQLVLNKIAILEKITVTKEELDKEVKHILKHYKGANPHNVSVYVETTLSNEKTFQLLEGLK